MAHTHPLVPLDIIIIPHKDPQDLVKGVRALLVLQVHLLQQLMAGLQVIQACLQEPDHRVIRQIQIIQGVILPLRIVDPKAIHQEHTHPHHRHTRRLKEWGGLPINNLLVMVHPQQMEAHPQQPELPPDLQDLIIKAIMVHLDQATHPQPHRPVHPPL